MTGVQPAAFTVAASTTGSKTTTLQRNGLRRAATARPMRPKPTTPTVISFRTNNSLIGTAKAHLPDLIRAAWAEILRTRSRIMARALSATSSMQ